MFCVINRCLPLFSPINCFASKNNNNRLAQNGNNCIRMIFRRSYSDIGIQNWIETLSTAEKEKVRFIQNEIQLLNLENKSAPQLNKLRVQDYSEMLGMTNNRRHKHYSYLYSVHWTENAANTKSDLRQKLMEAYAKSENPIPERLDDKYRLYGLGRNCYLSRIYNRTLDAVQNRSVMRQIILNAPKIIFDLGFDNQMTPRENKEAAKQLVNIVGINRSHQLPFVMHFCNAHNGNILARHMRNMIPNLHKQPFFLHEEDYLDAFKKEEIVILTPDSPNALEKYNPYDNYIISAIVDRGDMKPLTLSKSKKYDIRTARLPLEQYRSVRQNRVLTLDQIFKVMLDVKMFGNWDRAFNHVAPRKFK